MLGEGTNYSHAVPLEGWHAAHGRESNRVGFFSFSTRRPALAVLTEGGGDSRPIRGVFSQRGFWKAAFWALRITHTDMY